MKDLRKRWYFFDDEGDIGDDNSPSDDGKAKDDDEDKEVKKYSDAELNKIVEKKKAKWMKQLEKEKAEAAELAKMDAQQKAEYERDKLQKELEELKAQNTRSNLIAKARATLSAAGINVSDVIVNTLIGNDEDSTISNADSFIKEFNASLDSAVKEKIGSNVPKKGSGSPTPMTKDDILKIKNPELRQKAMLENRKLFNF